MTDTALYAELQQDIRELFDEFGFTASLVKAGTSTYTIATGAVDTTGDDTVPIVGILMPVDASLVREQGGLVRSTDEMFMFAATDENAAPIEKPAPGTTITFDGTVYEVITSTTLRPGNIALYHSCVLRG